MASIFQPLLFMLAGSTEDQLIRQIEFLKAENEILRKRIPKKRIFLELAERAMLLKLGKELGPAIRQLITIVSYSAFRRWVRTEEGRTEPNQKGRPRLAVVLRELVVRIAQETGWGYSRILGEVRKLKVGRISRQSVKNILVEHGLDPGPKRGRGTWSEFLRVHSETLWQCDFFSKRVWTLAGPRQIFALAFIHLRTRRVFVTPSTFKSDADWMKTQALAFLEHTREQQLDCSIVLRDRDSKFSKPFDQAFTDRSIRVKPVGRQAPNLNAYIERWVQSLKYEALNHFIVFGQEHFDFIVLQYVAYYHECRPHQGIGNVLLPRPRGVPDVNSSADDESAPPLLDLANVKCDERLGGLLKHYYRTA
jgi:Integrase core domain